MKNLQLRRQRMTFENDNFSNKIFRFSFSVGQMRKIYRTTFIRTGLTRRRPGELFGVFHCNDNTYVERKPIEPVEFYL